MNSLCGGMVATRLMVLRCFQVCVSCLDLIIWAEVMYELKSELSPSGPWEWSHLLCESHGLICETHSMITFHKREDPIDLCLVISKLGWGQPNVKVAWIKKCMSFHAISYELTRSHRPESMGSSIQGIEGVPPQHLQLQVVPYRRVYSSTQCNKYYQLIADIVKRLALQTKLSFHGTKAITIILHGIFR